jgi:membrane protease YdiL (CAAX protease family)
MDEMPVADTPDMPSGRWWLLVLAAAACTALYLASTISAYLLSELGGRTIAGAVIGMAAVAVLCIVAVRLAATLAFPGGGAPGDIIGRARSHSVGSAVTVQVVFLLLISPLLTVLGRTVGFRGTTNIALHHRSAAVVLLLTWIAVVIAPWMEEVSMRGFLFSGLDARLGFWPAAIASSLVWAGLHGVSGVLVPFTVEGIVLCWIRRRTGSVRTGIALHASQNVLASLVSGAGLLVVPAVAAVVVSLIATRADAPNTVGPSVSRLLARAGRTAERVAARIPTGGERPLVWILAGAALCAGIVLVALSLPPLAWLLLSARRTWDAPAAGCLAGAAGCAIIIASRVGILLGSATLVPLVGLGYTLAGFGFLALATTAIDVRARAGAVVAGLLLLATLTPIPYLITTAQAMVDQTLITSLGAALAIVSIGLTLRRPDRSRTDYAWGPQTPAPMPPL